MKAKIIKKEVKTTKKIYVRKLFCLGTIRIFRQSGGGRFSFEGVESIVM